MIEITAGVLISEFSVGGNLSLTTGDAAVRLLIELDRQMYGGSRSRWRHFLPPSWAVSSSIPNTLFKIKYSQCLL